MKKAKIVLQSVIGWDHKGTRHLLRAICMLLESTSIYNSLLPSQSIFDIFFPLRYVAAIARLVLIADELYPPLAPVGRAEIKKRMNQFFDQNGMILKERIYARTDFNSLLQPLSLSIHTSLIRPYIMMENGEELCPKTHWRILDLIGTV